MKTFTFVNIIEFPEEAWINIHKICQTIIEEKKMDLIK